MDFLENPHPGVILQEEFLEPMGLKAATLAKAIDVPPNRISNLLRGRLGVSADTDLRLARFFSLSDGYWLRLQNAYDLMEVKRQKQEALSAIQPCSLDVQESV